MRTAGEGADAHGMASRLDGQRHRNGYDQEWKFWRGRVFHIVQVRNMAFRATSELRNEVERDRQ
jgi:hypothetical protein